MKLNPLFYVTAALLASLQPAACAPGSLQRRASRDQKTLSALNAASQGKPYEHKTVGKRGGVATEVDVCSNVGADLLKAGGSAADAIIGASLCVNSIDSFHSGIAGGGFILLRDEEHSKHDLYDGVRFIDMRETAPAASTETMYSSNPNANASTIGGLAVGVPGELRGFDLMHNRYGKLPWKQILKPIIELNRHGFKVPSQLALSINKYKDSFICKDQYFKEVYCASGKAAELGDLIKNERLAKTFESLSRHGVDSFYTGPIGNRMVQTIKERGGIMTLDDLKGYKAVLREPMSIEFPNDKRVWSTSAPSSGAVLLSALKTIGTYGENSLHSAGVNLTTHRLIESTKFAYGERGEYGDPTYVKNVTHLEKLYLSDEDTKRKRGLISDNTTHPAAFYDPKRLDVLTDHGTSHLVAMDDNGLSVTLTTTVNLLWGSQIMTSDGIVLNDEMDDFSSPKSTNAFGFTPSSANFIRPGKRPLSSISPVIVVDKQTGKTIYALGSAGGSRIITANIINTFNALNGIDLQESIAMPRWHDQLMPATTSFEWADAEAPKIPGWRGFNNATVAFLANLGHNVSFIGPGQSTAQGMSYSQKEKVFRGATEIRQLAAHSAAV